jgi:DNA-binding transcriptional regulator YiaG
MLWKNTNVEYPIAGLKLLLVGLPTPICKKCGNKEISIPAIKNLYIFVARLIIDQIPRPSGEQIKFLRKFMGMTQGTFHRYLTQDKPCAETVSRWENNQTKPADTTIFLIKKMAEEYIIMQHREYENLVNEIVETDIFEKSYSGTKFVTIMDFIERLNKAKTKKYPSTFKVKYTGTAYTAA